MASITESMCGISGEVTDSEFNRILPEIPKRTSNSRYFKEGPNMNLGKAMLGR